MSSFDTRAVGSTAVANDTTPLRFGLIGCGDVAAKRVAAALREAPGSALLAASRARAELLPQFAKDHGISRTYADWRDLLRDPEVDAVYLATPVALHAEQTIAAAKAGKHVLCEKPMALDVDACRRMNEAARANGVRLGVAYYRHHYPVVARMRDALRSGEIGAPVFAHAQAFERFNASAGQPRGWLLQRSSSGGGPMADFGCHRIEVLLDLLGPVKSASGVLTNALFKERDVEDTCIATLLFEGGASGMVTVTHAAHERRDSIEILGTEGAMVVPTLNDGVVRITTAAGTREESHPPHPNLHLPLVEDFVRAVRERHAPTVSGEVGLAVQEVLAKIYAGRPV